MPAIFRRQPVDADRPQFDDFGGCCSPVLPILDLLFVDGRWMEPESADGIRALPNWRKSAALRNRIRIEFDYRTNKIDLPHKI